MHGRPDGENKGRGDAPAEDAEGNEVAEGEGVEVVEGPDPSDEVIARNASVFAKQGSTPADKG